jgi:hypothetical protein
MLDQKDKYFSYNPEDDLSEFYDFNEDDIEKCVHPWNSRIAFYLTNLCKHQSFISNYKAALPLQIYTQTIKQQSDFAYKLMLNQNIDETTITQLLNLIQEMTLDNYSENTASLEQLSKVLKEDLNEASKLEDISFIQKVIVPLLHSEKKSYIRINVL